MLLGAGSAPQGPPVSALADLASPTGPHLPTVATPHAGKSIRSNHLTPLAAAGTAPAASRALAALSPALVARDETPRGPLAPADLVSGRRHDQLALQQPTMGMYCT